MQTKDSGKTWKETQGSMELGNSFVSVDFSDSLTGYALCRGGFYYYMFKTTDGGNRWDSLTQIIGLATTWVYAKSKDTVYACGTYGGIHQSIDGGKNWEFINDYLGFWTDEDLQCIRFAKGTNTGWTVGTQGTIIKIIEVSPTDIKKIQSVQNNAGGKILLTITNRAATGARRSIDIRYVLKKPDSITIRIFNVKGIRIATIMNKVYTAAGKYVKRFDISGVSAGAYICVLETGSGMTTQQFEIIR
jgi:hypothetical protein